MDLRAVHSQRDLRAFIDLPYRIYQRDRVWVPPLRDEQRAQYDPRRNPLLDHCEWQSYLLEEQSMPIGRITEFVDRLAVDFWKQPIGLFGYFECVQDPHAAGLLLEAARDRLLQREMQVMRGPWTFVSQEWGMVVEGFSPPPVVMAPYNPPFYNDYLTAFGLQKVKDLLCWVVAAADGYQIPARILHLTDVVASRYGIHIRALNMSRYEAEVKLIVELSSASIIANWDYSQVTEAGHSTQGCALCGGRAWARGGLCHRDSGCQSPSDGLTRLAAAVWLAETADGYSPAKAISDVCAWGHSGIPGEGSGQLDLSRSVRKALHA